MEDPEFFRRFSGMYEEVVGRPPPTDLTMETPVASLGLDSLDWLELLTILEEQTGRRVSDDAMHEISSVADVRDLMSLPSQAGEG